MRLPRLKLPADCDAFYHCISRVVDQRFIFGDTEKLHFLSLLRDCEHLCRVRVLAFSLMSNHFHLLIHVPPKPQAPASLDQVLDDLQRLPSHPSSLRLRDHLLALRHNQQHAELDRCLASFHARIHDLSTFMKLLKQRFSCWYNSRHQRRGTLWEERFKSVLVDGAGKTLVTMAAYIDLNAVRAGLVRDPKDYRWCSYGEAVAGLAPAREGLQYLVTVLGGGQQETIDRSLEIYRQHLYLQGDERRESTGPDGEPVRGALAAEDVAKVLQAKGKLPLSEYLKCRVRYFCDGAVLGSQAFVEEQFHRFRHRFGPRRQTGARRMRGLADVELFTWRDLQRRVFGHPSA